MPLQDLTPELRTRLSAVERTVGWFVMLATIILLAGFGFYIYQTGKSKGWFITKVNYATSMNDVSGINIGDHVKLMGFDVGEVSRIEANEPDAKWGVTVFFWIKQPYFGYIWLDSKVRVNQDFLGHSTLEVLKGHTGAATAYREKTSGEVMVLQRASARVKFKELTNTVDLVTATNSLNTYIREHKTDYYVSLTAGKYDKPIDLTVTNFVWITPVDSTPLADRLAGVANTVEAALPNILNLTNQLSAVLTNAAAAVARLDHTLADFHPTVTNLNTITGNLTNANGSLGDWLIPTNLVAGLHDTLTNANATLTVAHSTLENADTNLLAIATDLDHTLIHLSDITSNLAWQVQGNTNLVTELSTIIVHTDSLIEGLKRHWFLRSAFKTKATNKVEKSKSR